MTASDFNFVLYKLYKSTVFRELFFIDPQAQLKKYTLSKTETKTLNLLNEPEIQRLSGYIKSKRKKNIRKIFNVIYLDSPDLFNHMFDLGFEELNYEAQDTYSTYAIKFGHFMTAYLGGIHQKMYLSELTSYLTDLLIIDQSYEYPAPQSCCAPISHLDILSKRPNIKAVSYRYPISQIMQTIKAGTMTTQPVLSPYFCILYKHNREIKKLVSTSFAIEFLNRCNSISTIGDLFSQFKLDPESQDYALSEFLPQLINLNLMDLQAHDSTAY